jgi:two-component system alkaline phosphatase synthesis response regulator PhoP
MTQRILVVEDDLDMQRLLSSILLEAQFSVECSGNGNDGLAKALTGGFDLVILDVSLPGMNGLDICTRLRQKDEWLPVVFLTSKTEEVDRVLGFALGCDDYVTKPFSEREIVFRLHALLRRTKNRTAPSTAASETLTFGPLEIDERKRRVTLRGGQLSLTALEFDLLMFLANHPGQPFTREDLMERVWGFRGSEFGAAVTTQMNRLRHKLAPPPGRPTFIHTVRGIGYRFADPSEVQLSE